MPTYTALTTLAGRTAAEALGVAMERLDPAPAGIGVFELEDGSGLWEVGGYFTEPPDPVALDLLAAAMSARAFNVSELPEMDWVAHVRRELHPVEAGRFFVYGSHDEDRVSADRVSLLIEASMAFGTGHHGTTQGCLRALDRLLEQGVVCRRVLDIGCGTAVLAMAAAKVWPERVIASDIDEIAVEVAETNIRANGLEGRVRCLEAAGFGHDAIVAATPFDLVFANILKGPLMALAPDMAVHVATGGRAILSGILTHQANDVIGCYETAGFALQDRDDIGDWSTLTLRRI